MDSMQRFLDGLVGKEYSYGMVTRREFLRRVALIGGGSAVALTLGGALACAPEATPTPTLSPTPTPGPAETVAPPRPTHRGGPGAVSVGRCHPNGVSGTT